MNKYASWLAAGLTLGLCGCASSSKMAVNPVVPVQNQVIPIVEVDGSNFGVMETPSPLTVKQEIALDALAEKLYEKIQKKNWGDFTPVEFRDEATETFFTVGTGHYSNKPCLDFFLARPGSDKEYFMVVDEYPLGSPDQASCQTGELPVGDPMVKKTYETLLRKSYQHINKASPGSWKLEVKMNDSELFQASENIFKYIDLRD